MLEELVAQPHCIYVYGCNKICLNYMVKQLQKSSSPEPSGRFP